VFNSTLRDTPAVCVAQQCLLIFSFSLEEFRRRPRSAPNYCRYDQKRIISIIFLVLVRNKRSVSPLEYIALVETRSPGWLRTRELRFLFIAHNASTHYCYLPQRRWVAHKVTWDIACLIIWAFQREDGCKPEQEAVQALESTAC
jgi:hypothetical protein